MGKLSLWRDDSYFHEILTVYTTLKRLGRTGLGDKVQSGQLFGKPLFHPPFLLISPPCLSARCTDPSRHCSSVPCMLASVLLYHVASLPSLCSCGTLCLLFYSRCHRIATVPLSVSPRLLSLLSPGALSSIHHGIFSSRAADTYLVFKCLLKEHEQGDGYRSF